MGSLPVSNPSEPVMEISGVRSSWLTVATNSFCINSPFFSSEISSTSDQSNNLILLYVVTVTHGRGSRSLLPLLEHRIARRRRLQATPKHQGGQRDLLHRPSHDRDVMC